MSSHSKALQTASELGTSRSALNAKCSPKQRVTGRAGAGTPCTTKCSSQPSFRRSQIAAVDEATCANHRR
jgi:hypothetical protein